MNEKLSSNFRLIIIFSVTLLTHVSENKIGSLLPTMLPLMIEWHSIGFSKGFGDYSILLTYFIAIHFYLLWLKITTTEVANIIFKK